ncbi:mevalonate kinase family protein [Amycolatopsis japonica]
MHTRGTTRVSHPVRACLSGEDLDWLGGRSVCVAIDLCTTVEVDKGGVGAGRIKWAAEIWSFLRDRVPGLRPEPPLVCVTSQAPSASGLSSSTALILGLFEVFIGSLPATVSISRHQVIQWAYEFEFAICNGGGMDHLAIASGGVTLFQGRTTGLPAVGGRMDFPAGWSLVVIDSGTPKSTPDHIRSVRAQCASGDPVLAEYVARSDEASGAIWQGIRAHDLEAVSACMADAHEAMRDCQHMSTPLLEQLRALADKAADIKVKVSGAGGGGALVGVCATADAPAIASALRAAYRETHPGASVIVAESTPSLS